MFIFLLLERVEEKLKNHNRDLSMVSDLFMLGMKCMTSSVVLFVFLFWLIRITKLDQSTVVMNYNVISMDKCVILW